MLLLLAAFPACTSENLYFTTDNNGKSIKLYLNTRGNEIARAVADPEAGEDNYGENTIEIVDVFFYQTDNKSYLHHSFNVKVSQTADNEGYYTANVPLPDNSQINLAGSTVYVVGNGTVDITEERAKASTSETISNLLMKFQTSTLKNIPSTDSRFIMDGQSTVTGTGTDMNAKVDLARAAAKISLTVNIPKELVIKKENSEETITYVPSTNLEQEKKISAIFYNGIETYNLTDIVKFDTESRVPGLTEDGEKSKYIAQFSPFYSYPTSWNISAADEPYIMLTIPWKVKEGSATSFKEYYYRVPVNKTNFDEESTTSLSLKRNHWYKITLDVNVLGTPEPNTLLPATSKYEIAPWGNFPIGTNLLDFKYLVVDQLNINMDNIETSNNIGYKSSSPITVKVTSIKFWDYYYSEDTPSKEITINGANYWTYSEITKNEKTSSMTSTTKYTDNNLRYNNDKYTTSWNEKTFFLNHPFKKTANNVIDTYVKYEITLLVSNDDGLTETVTINQYPPIYIEGEVNPDVKNKTKYGYPNRGYVIINNRNDAKGSSWENANSLSGDNKNTSMYVIHVTTLINSAYSNFLVGESREKKDSKTFTEAKNDDLGKALEHLYYSDNNNLSIAPTFRIASSFGVVYPISFDDAKRRCAGYQEAGYKAGRWRIPTESEAKFICGLSNDGKIPLLFTTDYEYWVSTGKTIENAEINNTIPPSAYVRCVYDEWYWGNDRLTDYTQFVWGNNKVY